MKLIATLVGILIAMGIVWFIINMMNDPNFFL